MAKFRLLNFCFSFLLCSFCPNLKAQDEEVEFQALLQFKMQLNDPMSYLESWRASKSPCSFLCVTCDSSTGEVIGISLAKKNLFELAYSLKITEKSDVYSFGVILLELLTGCSLFDPQFGEGRDIVYWVLTIYMRKELKMFLILSVRSFRRCHGLIPEGCHSVHCKVAIFLPNYERSSEYAC